MINKTIAIIPARGGSKRLPNKNILLLNNIPLLAHSILFAKANNHIISEVYVSTDSLEIKNIALKYGAKVIDRPNSLSGDLEPTLTAMRHVLQQIDYEVEDVILLQPTNPLRPENLLKDCYQTYIDLKVDSLFTVTQNHRKLGEIKDSKFKPFNYSIGQRSQDLQAFYFENGLLYITKSFAIFKNKLITENAFPYIVNHIFASVDIDTQDDFEYAQYLLKNTNKS